MALLVSESINLSPTTGSFKGDTTYISTGGGYLRFQVATNFTAGQFEYSGNLGQAFEMSCDIWAGGGSGADATYFYWGAITTPTDEDAAQSQYCVALDEFSNQIELQFNGVILATAAYSNLGNSTWRTLRVRVSGNNINVYVDGVLQISREDFPRTLGGNFFGWGGRSGGTNNEHRARNLVVSTTPQPQTGVNIALSAGVKALGAFNSSSSANQLVRTSTGNLYAIIPSNNQYRIYISTDNGATWSEKDSWNAPRILGVSVANASIAIDGNDLIHIAFQSKLGSSQAYFYVTFNTSTNTFGVPEILQNSSGGATSFGCPITVDSNGLPHIATLSNSSNTQYTNRVGGFWSKPVTIATPTIPVNIDLHIDSNNLPVVSFVDTNTTLTVTAAIGNKNNASSFTTNTVAGSGAFSTTGGAAIAIDASGNAWLAYQSGGTGFVMLAKHVKTDAWTTWQTAVTNSFSGKNVSLATDLNDVYVFYERVAGGIAYDRYDSVNGKWLGEQILQANTPKLTTAKAWHNPFVKWSTYFNNGDTGANNQNQQTIEYLFDDGSTVYYDKLITAQISTGLAQIKPSTPAVATTTSTSSTSTSTSTSISTSSTSTSISTSSTSTSISTSTSSTSTSISTSSTSTSISTSSTSTSISTSSTSTSRSTSTSSTSTSISTSSTSTSISTSSTSTSTSVSTSTSSTSTSTSISTSTTSTSTSISTTTSSTSTSVSTSSTSTSTTSTSTSRSTSTSSTSTSTSVSTSTTSTSTSTTSTSTSTTISITTSTSSTSTSISTSSTSTSLSTSSTSTSVSTTTSSTSTSISTSSTSKSTSTSSTSTSFSTSSTSTSTSISTSSTSTSISTSSTSTSRSSSTSSTSTSLSTSTSTSTSSTSTSTTISTTTSTSSTSTSFSSTSTSTSTTTLPATVIDMVPRMTITPDFYGVTVQNEDVSTNIRIRTR